MASYADRKGIAIISTIQGVFRILVKENRISRLDLKTDVQNIEEKCSYARDTWCKSITSQDLLRINEALKSWGLEIDKNMNEGKFRTMVLIKLGTLALDDLYSITKNTIRLEKLKPIRNLLSLVDDFFDPEGNAFISYEESNNLLNILYNNLRS